VCTNTISTAKVRVVVLLPLFTFTCDTIRDLIHVLLFQMAFFFFFFFFFPSSIIKRGRWRRPVAFGGRCLGVILVCELFISQ
jgi:hypothetical protein